MSLFENVDVSGWVRASEQRSQSLQRFDQGVDALRSAVKAREGRGIPAPATPIAVSPASVSFHGPDGADELAGELGVSADAWEPARERLELATTARKNAEGALATALSKQQSRVRFILAGLVLLFLYVRAQG